MSVYNKQNHFQMVNYFCFKCNISFLSREILLKHAQYAGHALHEIGQTFYSTTMKDCVSQCVCGTTFSTESNLYNHLCSQRCHSVTNQDKITCGCGSSDYMVFVQQTHLFYQCKKCQKRSPVTDTKTVEDNHISYVDSRESLLKRLETQLSTIEFAKNSHIILQTPECSECHNLMRLVRQREKSDGYIYVCYNKLNILIFVNLFYNKKFIFFRSIAL